MLTIHHVLDIDAPREAVWSALTERDRLAGWWSTKVETPPAAVGARVDWTFAGDFNPVMEIVELDDGRELVWRCVAGHDNWKDGLFRFELLTLDDGRTRLRFWQEYAVELSDDDYGVYNFNWGYYLESLRRLCAEGYGKPFPAQPLHDVRFPGESDEYRQGRHALLNAELQLRRETEAVSARRRALPLGGEVPADYTFDEWDPATDRARPVRLSELFEDGKDTLFLYSHMFVPGDSGLPLEEGCPACTSIIDAVDGEVPHITQQINFAVAAKAPIEQFRAHAQARGWRNARLLSSASNTYNADYEAEDADGNQRPMATVFARRDGKIRHVWSSELLFGPADPGQHHRHVDFMWPLWSVLDCTPEGRGTDYHPALAY